MTSSTKAEIWYTTYRKAARDGVSDDHVPMGNMHRKFAEVWTCASFAVLTADQQGVLNIISTRLCNLGHCCLQLFFSDTHTTLESLQKCCSVLPRKTLAHDIQWRHSLLTRVDKVQGPPITTGKNSTQNRAACNTKWQRATKSHAAKLMQTSSF